MCQRNNVQQLRNQQKTRNMFETLAFLEKQLEGQSVIRDADTVLADILEGTDFELTGIAEELLKIYQNSKDRESVETCFEALTGWTLSDYLKKCIATVLDQRRQVVPSTKEYLVYQEMHFFPVGKRRAEEGELSIFTIENENAVDRMQELQEQTGLDIFLCMEDYRLYFLQDRKVSVYLPKGRRRMYADKYSLGRESAK